MAQKDHWCDRCCDYIQPGDMYEGMVYASKKWSIITLKFHKYPACDYPEEPDDKKSNLEMVVEKEIKEAA
ncbi:hypothetical protein GOV04_00360 [Candidatus Woesearchaeota archaeon]|nr:hypothetical protein [Candidatus Woesearchaeota archaeon]